VKAWIRVMLKPEVLDPQGAAIQRASASLGHAAILSVRQGKIFEIELDTESEESARALLGELCEKLLSNPVIERYEILRLDS
jgi:phosphoribosylformylglycinamidine synthase